MDWIELGRNIQPWATVGGMAIAGASLLIASRSLRLTYKTNNAKFVFDLTDSFLKEPKLKAFWYRLDYDGDPQRSWIFDLHTFRHSEEGLLIDSLLYKFVVIGHLLKTGALKANDMAGLYIICRQTFHNYQVREYLRFIQIDFYYSDCFTILHFENALYCYEQLTRLAVRKGQIRRSELKDCRSFIAELASIAKRTGLRESIAVRIGYALPPSIPQHRFPWLSVRGSRKSRFSHGQASQP